jgi:RHS repeat-associated protein
VGYTGHSFDADAGLVYAQQRWYSSQLGRFLSEDPLMGSLATPSALHPWGYANGNPTRYVDPDGRIAFVPLLIYAGLTAIIGVEANIIYQEVAEGAGVSKPIEWGRAFKFGGAAGATVLSGGLFGAGAAASGVALGGGFDVASQMIMQGRSLQDVSWESAFVLGGYGSLIGGGMAAGMKSSIGLVRVGTGVVGVGLGVKGTSIGIEDFRKGYQAGNWGQMAFGIAEAGLSILGTGASARTAGRSALQMAGRELVVEGLGSNFGNVRLRKTQKPDGGSGARPGPMAGADDGDFEVFFSVQDDVHAARLRSGGGAWPFGVSKSLLGEGFYTWRTRAQAESYKALLEKHGATGLNILEARIGAAQYRGLKKLDLRTLSDDALDAWMDDYSLYGAGKPHGLEHVIRQTGNFGPEYFFSKEIFHYFKF